MINPVLPFGDISQTSVFQPTVMPSVHNVSKTVSYVDSEKLVQAAQQQVAYVPAAEKKPESAIVNTAVVAPVKAEPVSELPLQVEEAQVAKVIEASHQPVTLNLDTVDEAKPLVVDIATGTTHQKAELSPLAIESSRVDTPPALSQFSSFVSALNVERPMTASQWVSELQQQQNIAAVDIGTNSVSNMVAMDSSSSVATAPTLNANHSDATIITAPMSNPALELAMAKAAVAPDVISPFVTNSDVLINSLTKVSGITESDNVTSITQSDGISATTVESVTKAEGALTEKTEFNPDFYLDFQSLNSLKYHQDSDAALMQVAKKFEALFVQEMMKRMRSATEALGDDDNPLSNNSSSMFQSLFDNQLAVSATNSTSFGLAELLYQQLSTQNAANNDLRNTDV